MRTITGPSSRLLPQKAVEKLGFSCEIIDYVRPDTIEGSSLFKKGASPVPYCPIFTLAPPPFLQKEAAEIQQLCWALT